MWLPIRIYEKFSITKQSHISRKIESTYWMTFIIYRIFYNLNYELVSDRQSFKTRKQDRKSWVHFSIKRSWIHTSEVFHTRMRRQLSATRFSVLIRLRSLIDLTDEISHNLYKSPILIIELFQNNEIIICWKYNLCRINL